MNKVFAITYSVLLDCYRSRFFFMIFLLLLISSAIGLFAMSVSITEAINVNVSISAALMRLLSVAAVSLMLISTMNRELQEQLLSVILSSNITRGEYYFGKFIGYALVGFIVVFINAVLLVIFADKFQVFIWSFSLYFELLIVLGFSLLCCITLKHLPAIIFAVTGFYLIARSISAFELIAHSPAIVENSMAEIYTASLISVISLILPKFSEFANTDWLVYGTGNLTVLVPQIMQCLIYLGLIYFAGIIDFYRKRI